MGLKKLLVCLCLGLVSCSESGDLKEESGLSGEDLFLQRCASCHGSDGGLMGSSSPDLRKSILSAEQILLKINSGGNGMPAFRAIIADSAEKDSIVSYVLKLKK
ncbi:MAG: cytochrome c [Crocinitomicaceae bacterium]|nr:cytochrome c [Crocinitomicaceae bacterium]